ncbi:MAG TPA: vWA domain-containing protein, partial [Chroococcales cyanobacterium]
MKALFTARPAFSKFMGLASLVPVYAKSTAGVPVLDLIVCFDISGSMDDSTRVSFVNRHYVIPPPYIDTLNNLWTNYQTALNHLLGWQASPPQSQAQYDDCEYWYGQAVQRWNSYTDYQKNAAQQFGRLAWDQVEVGTLANCTFNPLFSDGLPLNTQFPQMLYLANWQKLQTPPANTNLPNFNSLERYFQETGDSSVFTAPGYFSPCNSIGRLPGAPSNYPCVCAPPPIAPPPNGFTDLIAKMDNSIMSPGNLQANGRPQQPLFPAPLTDSTAQVPLGPNAGNYRFTYVKKRPPFQNRAFVFDGLGYLVEAQRGNLEKDRFNTLRDNVFKNNIALGHLPQAGQDGYQDAYFEMCSYYSQPIGATVDALENFYEALNAVGSNVNFGLVAFETMAARNPGSLTDVAIDDISNSYGSPLNQYQWGYGNKDIGTTSANPPLAPAGNLQRPILYLKLDKLHDPANDLLTDPVDASRPAQTLNGIFETYLTPLRATNVAGALHGALDELSASPRKAFARQVVVLITDGIATRAEDGSASPPQGNGHSLGMQQSRLQAVRAQKMGVPIFTIGVAQN